MNNKISRCLVSLLATAVLGGLASGCAWSIGSEKSHPAVHQATRGQELMDLKKAKEQGAISEEEYNQQRQQILSR